MKRSNRRASALAVSHWTAILIFLATTACGPRSFGLASVSPQDPSWTKALVGAWALVDAPTRHAGTPRDTTVWHLDPGGRLRQTEVLVRSRGGDTVAKERDTQRAWWWVESQSVNGVQAQVLCTSARPARNRQCARIDLDTLARPDGRATRRFMWSGVTFKSQHWTFMERTAAGRAGEKG